MATMSTINASFHGNDTSIWTCSMDESSCTDRQVFPVQTRTCIREILHDSMYLMDDTASVCDFTELESRCSVSCDESLSIYDDATEDYPELNTAITSAVSAFLRSPVSQATSGSPSPQPPVLGERPPCYGKESSPITSRHHSITAVTSPRPVSDVPADWDLSTGLPVGQHKIKSRSFIRKIKQIGKLLKSKTTHK